jgi:hypothetical protein
MTRTEDTTTAGARPAHARAAGWAEVAATVAAALVVWRLVLGWDWAAADPGGRLVGVQSSAAWIGFGLVAMIAVGWLAYRGRAVAGVCAVCLAVIALSGWRMAAAGVVDWPTGLASLIFVHSATCMAAALLGTWLRRREAPLA